MAGHQAIEQGYKVFFLFVFTDCSKIMELKEDSSFKVKFTGSNCIKHYMIPVKDLDDFEPGDIVIEEGEELEEPEPEEELEKIN